LEDPTQRQLSPQKGGRPKTALEDPQKSSVLQTEAYRHGNGAFALYPIKVWFQTSLPVLLLLVGIFWSNLSSLSRSKCTAYFPFDKFVNVTLSRSTLVPVSPRIHSTYFLLILVDRDVTLWYYHFAGFCLACSKPRGESRSAALSRSFDTSLPSLFSTAELPDEDSSCRV
jgi:hypothetical protein